MAEYQSYIHKLKDFGFRQGEFKDETGKTVAYSQVAIRVQLDGDIEELVISGNGAPKPALLRTVLKGADGSAGKPESFLDV